jgi:hypothetical protein
MITSFGVAFSKNSYSPPPDTNMGTTYKTITINKTYVPSTQTNFVVRIAASILGAGFFTALGIGGSARFTASDGVTELAHEKVYLTTGSSIGYYNVLVPTVNGTAEGASTDIRVYYENALSDYAATATYGRNAVWANNYKCVQHLQTTPNLTQENSTGNSSYDMTGTGSLLSTDVVTAFYGGGNAHLYDSTGQGIKVPYCDITGFPFSMGVAFRTPTLGTDAGFIAGITDSTTSAYAYGFQKTSLKSTVLAAMSGSQGILYGAQTGGVSNVTTWNYVVAVYDSATSRKIYFNNSAMVENTNSVVFAGTYNNTGIGYADYTTDAIFSDNGDLSVQDFFLLNASMSANTYTTIYNNYTNGSFFTVT